MASECLIIIAPTALIWMSYTVTNAIIVLLHLTVFWGLAEILRILAMKFDIATVSRSLSAAAGILITVLYLGLGWYQAHHVAQTEYTVTTDKKWVTFVLPSSVTPTWDPPSTPTVLPNI